jgi:chromatin remodeling complex protein RSC6
MILCDDKLKELFNTERFQAFGLMKHLKPHILS